MSDLEDDYDPFSHLAPNCEVHRRINAVHRENQMEGKSNQPLVVDFSVIDAMAEEMISSNDLIQTRNHDMRRLAAAMVEDHLAQREQLIDTPERGPRVLFAFDLSVALPVGNLEEANSLAEEYLSTYLVCDVQSDRRCTKVGATHVLRVAYGEFACFAKCCQTCLLWFGDPNRRYHQDSMFGVSYDALFGDGTVRHPATE